MSRNILITFGGHLYENQVGRTVAEAPRFGVDKVEVYDDLWLTQQPFYSMNRWLWDHPHKRGFGWYAWKPYLLWHALERYAEGDVVLFLDGDSYPIKPIGHLYQTCRDEGGIMLFRAGPHKHRNWCKRDTYVVMAQDEPKYTDPNLAAGVARFMLFQKGPWLPTQFLMEWLAYCVNPLANTFDPSVLRQEYPELREPRVEQAIMTNLAYKYGIKLYPEADYEMGLFCQDNERPVDTRQNTSEVIGSRYCSFR